MLLQHSAIHFTVFSYRDSIEMGILASPTLVPQVQHRLGYLHEALPPRGSPDYFRASIAWC